jgi:poly(glycerol-phosphate) alpha-glucosyltransferase
MASTSRNAGGLFDSVRRLAQSLAILGMDVRVFGLLDEYSAEDTPAWLPVGVSALKPNWPEGFGYCPDLVGEVMSYRPDVIHNHGLWLYPSVATYSCFKKTRKPYIVSPHGMLDPWALGNSRWKKTIARALFEGRHLRNALCLRALCESEARSIRQCGLTNGIAVIPNGIDLPTSVPTTPPPWSNCVPAGTKTLLYLSRLHPKKGIPDLLRAWAAVRAFDPNATDWALCIAGWNQGDHEKELKQLATDLNLDWADIRDISPAQTKASSSQRLPGRCISVLFLGPQFKNDKAACYARCDAFVLPSLSEGLPMVVLEAWAHAKPVLMTPFSNLPEGFAVGAAVRADPNPESMAAGLREIFGMTQRERTAMGERGRKLVAERFAWSEISNQTNQLYQWMLGGGPKPACVSQN